MSCSTGALSIPVQSPKNELDTWFANFPGQARCSYLNTSSHGLQSLRVREGYGKYLESWRQDAPWETEWAGLLETTLGLFGRLFHTDPINLCTMPSVTVALQAVLSALDLDPGKNEVVINQREWISSHHVLQADRRFVPVVVPAEVGPDSLEFFGYMNERTCLVITSHVCYQTGIRCDLKRVAQASHQAGALVFADLYQSAGVVQLDLDATDVDFAATGTLKFLLGSPGIAVLYLRPGLAEQLEPRMSGWRGQRNPMEPTLNYAAGAGRFHGGTWPIPSLYAAHAGLELIFDAGLEAVAQRVEWLTSQFATACQERDFHLLTPDAPEHRGPIVTLQVDQADRLAELLKESSVYCSARGRGLRFSFHAYNTDHDIARAVLALESLRDISHPGRTHE